MKALFFHPLYFVQYWVCILVMTVLLKALFFIEELRWRAAVKVLELHPILYPRK